AMTLLCPSTIAQTKHPALCEPKGPASVRPQTLSPEDLKYQTRVPIERDPTQAVRPNRAAERHQLNQKLAEMKQRSTAIVALANSLEAELASTREDVLPVTVVQRAEKIEKLARDIKKWGKGLY
ncbi:MAG TPA: hypothetical protein VFM21_07860, partial [Terriglobia bacterium]|nr:hypothetical protein [Terriglobia bacterium]